MKTCLVCDNTLEEFIDFGKQPIANGFLHKNQFCDEFFFHMKVAFCPNCKMVQLVEQPDREQMFHENYSFLSSTSTYMKKHFEDFRCRSRFKKKLSYLWSILFKCFICKK